MRNIGVPVLIVVLLGAPSTTTGTAGSAIRHSGIVLALEPELLVLEEVGPWRVENGRTVVTRRTIKLTPATKFNTFIRVDVVGAFAGDFIEVALDDGDVTPGDFVTAECRSVGGRLVAITVTVAESVTELSPK